MTDHIKERVNIENRLTTMEMTLKALHESSTEVNQSLASLVKFMHKTEEHREADRRWRDHIQSEVNEAHQNLRDFKKNEFEPIRKKAEFNAAMLFVSGSVITLLLGAVAAVVAQKILGG